MQLTERDVILDIETRNKQELTGKNGVGTYKYVYNPSCELVLLSLTFGHTPNEPEYVYTFDLTKGEIIPHWVIDILTNPYYIKHSHNVAFEIGGLHNTLGIQPCIEQWIDDMALVAFCGLPLGLKDSSGALGHRWGKLTYGDQLVKWYCTPNKKGEYNHPSTSCTVYETDPITKKRTKQLLNWEHFVWYNKVDVLAEKENILCLPECPEITQEGIERDVFIMDYYINSRGLKINSELARKADILCDREDNEIVEAFRHCNPDVKIKNLNSGEEIKKWLRERGYQVDKLTADDYDKYLTMTERDEIAQQVLSVKQNLSLTSATKFEKFLLTAIGERIYGTLQYYAANRTGRWGGRGAQPQNLKRNEMSFELLSFLRDCVLRGDYTQIKQVFGSVKDNIIELGRTVIEPDDEDSVFMPTDFSAIEARVTAWLADEQWRLDVFNTHGKIYEASASMMFKIPIESVKKGSLERLKGKYAELALGFSGWVGAFYRFGADKFMTSDEMLDTANLWRRSNRNIVNMWNDINDTAVRAVADFGNPHTTKFGVVYQGIEYKGRRWLTAKLLSGRRLFYYDPRLTGTGNKRNVTYRRNYGDQDTWRGMLTENLVQAIARDLLVYKMWYIWKVYGILPHLHVHDELVYQFKKDVAEQWKPILDAVMAMEIDWAKGLPLKGDTSIIPFYMKPED